MWRWWRSGGRSDAPRSRRYARGVPLITSSRARDESSVDILLMCLLLSPTTGPKIAALPSLNTSGFLRWSHSRAHKNTILLPLLPPPPIPLPAVTRASRSVRVCAYPSRALSGLLNGLQRPLCGGLPASRITCPDEQRSCLLHPLQLYGGAPEL